MQHSGRSREAVAVAIRADGRRVATPIRLTPSADVSLFDSLKALGLGLLALITGSRLGVLRETERNRR